MSMSLQREAQGPGDLPQGEKTRRGTLDQGVVVLLWSSFETSSPCCRELFVKLWLGGESSEGTETITNSQEAGNDDEEDL